MLMKNRKIILFLISLIAVSVLSFLSKDYAGIVTLYAIYCTGNVTQKFRNKKDMPESMSQ